MSQQHKASSDALARSMRGPSASASPESTSDAHPNWTAKTPSKKPKDLPVPSPSASILLISPQNRILLLHRVAKSSSFASAHVFPGGHVDTQDGSLPPISHPTCHEDSEAYRMAAIRECFEESGILLAYRNGASSTDLLDLSANARDEGRKDIHNGTIPFQRWVDERGGVPDTDGLVPFTRWLTPANIPKRFSTQMYLYFLPLEASAAATGTGNGDEMHIPTPDGGVEHTAAQFLYPQEWIRLALDKEIVLFPPQFFLLSLVGDFLFRPPQTRNLSRFILEDQRTRLMEFVKEDCRDPSWGEKCISPDPVKLFHEEGEEAMIMGLAEPGPELEGTGRKGDTTRVIKVELDKEIERGRQRPRPTAVIMRRDWERGAWKGGREKL